MKKHVPGISECYKKIENKWDTPSTNLKYSGTERFIQYDPQSKEWLNNWYQKNRCVNNVLTVPVSKIPGCGSAAQRLESNCCVLDSRVAGD